MNQLLEMMQNRRSIRKYTDEHVTDEQIKMILQAGMLAPTSKNCQCWEFVVVKDKAMLEKLSKCRPMGPQMLKGADCAIVVLGDEEKTNVWAEDCSASIMYMHLMADSLGLGSCWVQGRLRPSPDDRMAEDVVRDLLGMPENMHLSSILSLGVPAEHHAPKLAENVPMEKVHYEKW